MNYLKYQACRIALIVNIEKKISVLIENHELIINKFTYL